jgi:hypothetical protein
VAYPNYAVLTVCIAISNLRKETMTQARNCPLHRPERQQAPWCVRHLHQALDGDVFDFIDLKKNHEKEARVRDLFYALWIPDLL